MDNFGQAMSGVPPKFKKVKSVKIEPIKIYFKGIGTSNMFLDIPKGGVRI